MKKILFLFLLIPALTQAQLDTSIFWSVETPHFGIGSPAPAIPLHIDGGITIKGDSIIPDELPIAWAEGVTISPGWGTTQFRVPDCEPWEKFTEWQAKNTGKAKCAHDWVIAEWGEVNVYNMTTTLEMPPPCGKTSTENEARICRTCLRHETRVRMHGMKEVVKKSEYQILIEKISNR
jgi:hypothetical protein